MNEISLVGATFYGNRGAEAMLCTTIGMLRKEHGGNLNFNVFSYYPDRDKKLVADPGISVFSSTPSYLILILLPAAILHRCLSFLRLRFLHRLLPEAVCRLASSKTLVCLAGVSFVGGRTKFLPFNIATILPAMILDVPVVKFAQAMGPFDTRLNRVCAKAFLGQCRQIFTRGEKTHSYLNNLFGKAKNYQRADDIAFLFQPDFCVSKPAPDFDALLEELRVHRKKQRYLIGLCVSIVVAKKAKAAGQDYIGQMQLLINKLVQNGNTVVLYPNATRGEDMDKTHNNDLPLIPQVVAGLDSDVVKYIIACNLSFNAGQVQKIIKACDIQLVSRFHAMVIALAAAIPVMVIGWSHKYFEVMERFGQQDMVLDYTQGNIEPIVQGVQTLIENKEIRSADISTALPQVQDLAKVQVAYINSLISAEA